MRLIYVSHVTCRQYTWLIYMAMSHIGNATSFSSSIQPHRNESWCIHMWHYSFTWVMSRIGNATTAQECRNRMKCHELLFSCTVKIELPLFCWTKQLQIQQKKRLWRFKCNFPILGRRVSKLNTLTVLQIKNQCCDWILKESWFIRTWHVTYELTMAHLCIKIDTLTEF